MEVLFTFPSRYSFAIGLIRVFSLAGWSRQIRAGFLVSRVTQDAAMPFGASRTGLSPSQVALSSALRSRRKCNIAVLQPRGGLATATVWAPPRSLATTGGIINLFSLPRGTKMFQFPRFASRIFGIGGLLPPGLSHSEIRGSMAICAYPRLIAAYHVLLRLNEPRHPPCALSYFLSTLLHSYCGARRRPYFSCVCGSVPQGNLSLYSLACVNMSKIFSPTQGLWRISDSNR